MTWQIITAHHGYIFAESEVGRETSFHIFLPVHDREEQGDVAPGSSEVRSDTEG